MICTMEYLFKLTDFPSEDEVCTGLRALRRVGLLAFRESKGVLFMRLLIGVSVVEEFDEALKVRT